MQIQESRGGGWRDEANNINGRGQEITEQQGLTRRKHCSHEGVQSQCGRTAWFYSFIKNVRIVLLIQGRD